MKSITFRITSVIVLSAVTFILTGDIMQTATITIVFQSIQTGFYYAHERAWAHFDPGDNLAHAH